VRDRLLIAFKYMASFRKSDWQLQDYPVKLIRQETSSETPAIAQWRAQVLNWWLVGLGPTPEAALRQLRENLEAAGSEGPLPRPGTRPPLKFASIDRLAAHGDFAYEFVERVTGIRPFFMSDGTSLSDFAAGEDMAEVQRKVALLYNIDATELAEGPLWQLLDKVHPRDGAAEQRGADKGPMTCSARGAASRHHERGPAEGPRS
jgi:hypothetical protein